MNERKKTESDVVVTGRIEEAMKRYGLGRSSIRTLAKNAKAEIKFGRSYLINFKRVDEYLDSCSR